MDGYGNYGQVWDIPSQLLQNGTLSSYTPCTSCTGLGGGRKASGFGVNWKNVDESIKELYLGDYFGGLVSLQEVTKKKFGQPGVDAITNYPFLVRAKIHPDYYIKEEGTKRPADTFSIYMGNQVVAKGVTGRSPVALEDGTVIYQPAGGLPNWALPAALVVAGLGVFMWWRNR